MTDQTATQPAYTVSIGLRDRSGWDDQGPRHERRSHA